MKLTSLKIRNYRTLESLDLIFPSQYSAICGANDSGKTNVVRAIRALMSEEDALPSLVFQNDFSIKDEFPKWNNTDPSKREISFEISITLQKVRDAGFYQFVVKQLSLVANSDSLDIVIKVTYQADRPEPVVVVNNAGTEYSDLNAQEVLKKLQSSKSILFHNSTQMEPHAIFRRGNTAGFIREISGPHQSLVENMKKTVNRG
ncbi:MAG: AAA family ATPase, partial [bacterium]